MSDQSINYDDVKQYRLDPEREQELVNTAGECVFIWANKAGHPIGVITAYVPVDGKIWMTATRERVRIKAIARDPRSSVVMTSKGTPMGGGKTVTYKGHTEIHDDPKTKIWMYELLAAGMAMAQDDGNAFTAGLEACVAAGAPKGSKGPRRNNFPFLHSSSRHLRPLLNREILTARGTTPPDSLNRRDRT